MPTQDELAIILRASTAGILGEPQPTRVTSASPGPMMKGLGIAFRRPSSFLIRFLTIARRFVLPSHVSPYSLCSLPLKVMTTSL